MDEYESLSRSKWECKYHSIYTEVPEEGAVRQPPQASGRSVPEVGRAERVPHRRGTSSADHVHMMISIPPKYAVSQVVEFIKGKSAIHRAHVYGERKQNYAGQSFWARGYFVSTVGRDETTIREYIRNQEKEDQRIDQMNLWK